DGHGADCSGGPDCDDADPDNWVSCDNCADADADGYYYGCDAYTEIDGPDCHDGDAAVWQLLAGYKDADGDTYPGTAHQICSGDGLPPGFAAESTDCDDTDFTIHPDAVDLPDDGSTRIATTATLRPTTPTAFFVDGATGDDGDAGTKAAPFETVQKGCGRGRRGGRRHQRLHFDGHV
ncbi:MAG: hypothetical protein M5R36_24695, partial [Deltaproteobacteria bacterium]|nr:hypothetical protein [Deltaproteobacteria bacterium]